VISRAISAAANNPKAYPSFFRKEESAVSNVEFLSLESSLAFFNWLLDISISLVVIGLILEFAPRLWSRFVGGAPHHRIEKFGEILVILGVAGELALHIRSGQIEDRIKATQRDKIITLEERLAARSFSPPQAADLAARLKPFSPLTFQIIPYWDDKESFDLANRIDVILEGIGWKLENPTRFTMLAGVVAGVVIAVDKRASDNARNAAKELASALTANGVDAKEREEENPTTNPPSERINMSVGIKP
jgi:hypothetical protein